MLFIIYGISVRIFHILMGKPGAKEINEAGKWCLLGHLSRANQQAKSLKDGVEVLAIFNGPHAYVSSGWYNHANVPTWNYIAVHLYGKIRICNDEELHAHLTSLTAHYERNMAKPQDVSSMPAEMVKTQMKGIIGFQIEVTKIEGKWKGKEIKHLPNKK